MTSTEDLQPTQYLEAVSKMDDGVRANVLALQALQAEYQELFLQFCKDEQAIEDRCSDACAPLYARRREIVTGEKDATEAEIAAGKEGQPEEESKIEEVEDDGETPVKQEPVQDDSVGIPSFWLQVLKHEPELMQTIEEHDEPILENLIDISSKRIEEPQGFVLEFTFKENQYFSDTTLTKTYYTKLDEDDGEVMLEKAEGCKIAWNAGQDVTVRTKKKRQQSKSGKGQRVVDKVVANDSFFNLFSPPYAPDEEMTEAMADRMQTDYSAGCCIRERIIPRAVLWYTGEAAVALLGLSGLEGLQMDDDEEREEDGSDDNAQPQQDCKQQ